MPINGTLSSASPEASRRLGLAPADLQAKGLPWDQKGYEFSLHAIPLETVSLTGPGVQSGSRSIDLAGQALSQALTLA
jgi:hypothetical protein